MATISIPNLLRNISQKSFDFSDRSTELQDGDDPAAFPMDYFSRDYAVLNDAKSAAAITQEELAFLQLLKAAGTGKVALLGDVSIRRDAFVPIVNQFDQSQGATPLHYAALNGHGAMVQYLFEHGAKVDVWNRSSEITPLHCAAAEGHLKVVELLLKYKCDVNAGLDGYSSALLWAVRKNHPAVVRYLLDHGAYQNSAIAYSETPVHAAVKCGSPQILRTLINFPGFKGDLCWGPARNTPLHLAASGKYSQSFEMCKILLYVGCVPVDPLNAAGETPLHLAVASQDVKVVRTLLRQAASADTSNSDGRTPIFYTIADDREALKCIRALCEEGKCNINHQDNQGYTALHLAAFKEAVMAAELLLLEGADFSLKMASGGPTALSVLLRKIPTTDKLLSKIFDHAVSGSTLHSPCPASPIHPAFPVLAESTQHTKVKVDFNYVVASSPQEAGTRAVKNPAFAQTPSRRPPGFSRLPRLRRLTLSAFPFLIPPSRKETAKIKCLVDEDQKSLLLHPVVHSFVVLKWEKSRPIFLASFLLKAFFVLLTTVYLELPFFLPLKPFNDTVNCTNLAFCPSDTPYKIPSWQIFMYVVIITIATGHSITTLILVVRYPKVQLWSPEPWLCACIFIILMTYMYPNDRETMECQFCRAITALCMCLLWIDMWVYMARFPKFGMSIRIFFKVLQNFWLFIVPHVCLFFGFILAFTIIFPKNREFGILPNTLSKAILLMAGDNALPPSAAILLTSKNTAEEVMTHLLVIYIYAAYVLTMGIILMNMLIGLAVHDIQGIYAEASVNRLKKQTMLLNTLEAQFKWRCFKSWIPQRFLNKYINLFGSASQRYRVKAFKPCDSRDIKLDEELQSALVNLASTVTSKTSAKPEVVFRRSTESETSFCLSEIKSNAEAVNKFIVQSQADRHKLMRKVDNITAKLNLLMGSGIRLPS